MSESRVQVPERVKEVAREDFEHAKALANEAIRSAAYLYPFKGIAYFFTHRTLWKPLAAKLVPTISLGLGVTVLMFAVTYVPQAALLTIFNGPLAIFTTILLVLSEASTIFSVLSKNFLIDDALIDTFDGTLLCRNMTSLVSTEREVKRGSDPVGKLGKLVSRPFAKFTPKAIIRYFMYLPLNFIPIVGTVLFVILQGRKFGPTAHARYFQLKQMKKQEKERFIEQRKAAYASFGVPAVLLELVPIAGIFFSFTNTVGAALWAADLEERNNTAPNLRNQAELAKKSE
ncbi:Nn.00g038660.m01.CDS01 [Neocucurbitaria sp. VM-36]